MTLKTEANYKRLKNEKDKKVELLTTCLSKEQKIVFHYKTVSLSEKIWLVSEKINKNIKLKNSQLDWKNNCLIEEAKILFNYKTA